MAVNASHVINYCITYFLYCNLRFLRCGICNECTPEDLQNLKAKEKIISHYLCTNIWNDKLSSFTILKDDNMLQTYF